MAGARSWPRLKVWLGEQVTRFDRERQRYRLYAAALQEILQRACDALGVPGITQARAKGLPSYAEKAIRKADKYGDPVHQLTDLCGARVVAYTQAEADAVGQFIRENFRVDEANSLDVCTRLKTEEFGYRAIHYVVQVRRDAPFVAGVLDELGRRDGVNYWRQIGERKAEIQVHTLLQHAWAAIYHDRVYKAELRVPERLKRDLARVAALLEGADDELGRVAATLDNYREHHRAYMSAAGIREEIEKWEIVLAYDAANAALAHKIARLAIAIEDWHKAIQVLQPFRASGNAAMLRDLGFAKWKLCLDARPDLDEAVRLDPSDGEAWRILGDTWLHESRKQALKCYEQALHAAPSAPRVLASYLDCRIPHVGNVDFIPLMYPVLEAAVAKCGELADMGVYLPDAFYDTGIFALLLNRPYDSLSAFARAVALSDGTSRIEEALRSLDCLTQPILNSIPRMPELAEMDWAAEAIRRFLLLARVAKEARSGADGALAPLGALVSQDLRSVKRPIVMVVGGCDPRVQDQMEAYRGDLEAAFEGFEGTIIGGGTQQGISGIVGDIASRHKGAVQCLAYRPYALPGDASPHRAYVLHNTAEVPNRAHKTAQFSALEPIQGWIDLLAAGVSPSDVAVLVINGGPISAFECRMALALGARVGVVESSGRSATDLQADSTWWGAPHLLWLPRDGMTLRAFVNPGRSRMSDSQLERAGRAVHARFLAENRYKNLDPAMKPWPELDEGFRQSNRDQIACAEHALRKVGYGIRKATGKIRFPRFTTKAIETMAEIEHGRWVVERLSSGWRYGPARDPKNKISPYLVPWNELPDDVKGWDRDAVSNFPTVLATAGLEVFPLRRPHGKGPK